MERFIAVDSGKFANKVAEYDAATDCIRSFQIRTKVSEGDFRDDAIEDNTVIVEYEDQVYKVGNGARGSGIDLSTDKRSYDHKICILTAIATLVSSKSVDEINVAIGIPAKEWANVSTREDMKEMMFPTGEICIRIKINSDAPITEKHFIIKNRFVYPESIGALFMDDSPMITPSSITGVIDLGNLNLNATLYQGTEPVLDKTATDELGGAILLQELAQEISSNICRCDEMVMANIIKGADPGDRVLPKGNLSDDQIEESRSIIKRVMKEHALKVKKVCQKRNWSLDITNIVAIGGTSYDLREELNEVFGNLTILNNTQYCNCYGYLRIMCAKLLGKEISLTSEKERTKESKSEKAS